ncbi:MAG: hypothetical protein FWD57_17180 [Polyangiaceae bacterium]|nr:hypothetical protein [Polyangiaceae bacterium]
MCTRANPKVRFLITLSAICISAVVAAGCSGDNSGGDGQESGGGSGGGGDVNTGGDGGSGAISGGGTGGSGDLCVEGTTCDVGKVCDSNRQCVDGCFIGGKHYDHGISDESNECRACTESDTTGWSVKLGAPCSENGGAVCNGDGKCVKLPVISAGYEHTCAITMDGAAKCWGKNDKGQLGNGTTKDSAVPVTVQGLEAGVVDISAGANQSCAITSSGQALCWGGNRSGVLGTNSSSDSLIPAQVYGLESGAVAIAAGVQRSCAIITNGAVRCWGENGLSIDGTAVTNMAPAPVSGFESGAIAISTGNTHVCAVNTAGAVLCWGWNHSAQLGDGTVDPSSSPKLVSGLDSGFAAVSAGSSFTCALSSAGSAMCWGYNVDGRLGNGTTSQSRVPAQVSGLTSGVDAIAAGHASACALLSTGAVKCWGENSFGQLGIGNKARRTTPTQVSGLESGAIAISVGGTPSVTFSGHACALTSTGKALCWGYNATGQLGNGSKTDSNVPVEVVDFP